MDLLPGLPIAAIGLLVLIGSKGIAEVFTGVQQQDQHFAHPSAGLFQRINTVLFGIALHVYGLFDVFT